MDGDVYDGNEIIFCDKCNVPVHQSCYGVSVVPEGAWYCAVCINNQDPLTTICQLCSNTGGAYKPTDIKGQWVHSLCSLWIPEVYYQETKYGGALTLSLLSSTGQGRFRLKCGLCTKKGASIQCSYGRCTAAAHPW
jgi:NuA3 HAT complex component NTO1